jgi:hypothetical protein
MNTYRKMPGSPDGNDARAGGPVPTPSTAASTAPSSAPDGDDRTPQDDAAMQGEGNYSAARRHRESVEQFVQHTDVEAAARDAAPDSDQEAADLKAAEEAGRSHARR